MKNPLEKVDRLSKEALDEWETPPPPSLAGKIQRRMFWFNFWHKPVIRSMRILLPVLIITSTSVFLFLRLNNNNTSQNFANLSFDSAGRQAGPIADNNPGEEQLISNKYANSNNTQISNNTGIQTQNKTTSKVSGNEVNGLNTSKSDDINVNNSAVTNAELIDNNNDSPASNENTAVSSGGIGTALQNDQTQTSDNPSDNPSNAFVANNNVTTELFLIERLPSLGYQPDMIKTLESSSVFGLKPSGSRPRFSLNLNLSPVLPSFDPNNTGEVTSKVGMPSGSAGIGLNWNLNNFFIGTGLQYTTMQRSYTGSDLLYNPHEIYWQEYAGQLLALDTSSYWEYKYIQDSVIHVFDSVWVTEIDSSYTDVYQNLSAQANDTLSSAKWKMSVSLIEMPIAAGYRFIMFNTGFSVKGGILLGMVSRVGGQVWKNSSANGLVPASGLYVSKSLQFSWFVSASINRQISERWAIELSPFYRSSIGGLKGSEGNASMKYSSWGIGLGFNYEF